MKLDKDDNIRLTKEQVEKLVDNNPYILEYILEMFITLFRNPANHWDWLDPNKKIFNSEEAAKYLGFKTSYMNHLCTHNLIQYNKFGGKREFEREILDNYRRNNSVIIKALTEDEREEFNKLWANKQRKRSKV